MQISSARRRVFISRAPRIVINSPNRSTLRNRVIGALIRYAPADVSLQGNTDSHTVTVVRGVRNRRVACVYGKVTGNKIPDIRRLLMPRRNAKRHLHRHFISTRTHINALEVENPSSPFRCLRVDRSNVQDYLFFFVGRTST